MDGKGWIDCASSCGNLSSGKNTSPSSSSPSSYSSILSIEVPHSYHRPSCDAAELQARVILYVAKRETEERLRTRLWQPYFSNKALQPPPSSAAVALGLVVPPASVVGPGVFSMKRSLESFLKRRKSRMTSVGLPYGHRQTQRQKQEQS